MNQGFIFLHRQFLDWEWYDDLNTKSLFIHLLLKANHKDNKHRGVLIKRGQLITGLHLLNYETGISIQSLRTSLKRLVNTREINMQTNNQNRLITVCNYDTYQQKSSTTNKQTNKRLTSKQQATNKQLTTNNNDNNDNNDNKINFDLFWNLYDKKINKLKSEPKWNSLSFEIQKLILKNLADYIESTPDKKYRKNPMTYLNAESWNDEVNDSKSIIEQYESILETTSNNSYKLLIKYKYDTLIRFDSVISENEFRMLKLNGQVNKGFYIAFLEYGKTKKDFLNNLYRHAKKY